MPSKGLDARNTRAGLVKDCLEQSWWPQQAKVDACLGFVPGALIQTSSVELDEICQWVSDAWDDIPPEMVAKSFRKCCITNALDGTEDDAIWEEESDSDLDEMDGDHHLYYGEYFEQQNAEIDPECFKNIFGESDSEDSYGF